MVFQQDTDDSSYLSIPSLFLVTQGLEVSAVQNMLETATALDIGTDSDFMFEYWDNFVSSSTTFNSYASKVEKFEFSTDRALIGKAFTSSPNG